MNDYSTWSLKEIKQAMRDAYHRIREMESLYETYANAANQLDVFADNVHSARGFMQQGWQGPAADAASNAMSSVVQYSHHSRNSSGHMGHIVDKLARSTAYHHDKVDGVPDVDTSWAASMQSSYMNPFMAMPDHSARVYQATKNQQVAAQHAAALDTAAASHEDDMRQVHWPAPHKKTVTTPPRRLPTRQHAVSPPPRVWPPITTPPPGNDPGTNPGRPRAGDRAHENAGNGTSAAAETTSSAGLLSVGSGPGATTAAGTGTAGPGALGGASGGGLGGLTGGLTGGLGGSLGGSLGGAGGLAGPGDAAGLEPGPRFGAGEPAAAGRGAVGAAAEGGAAGERGLLGAPGGGRGGSRDEQEHNHPDYLDEDDDVWAVRDGGVPPVLGED